MTTRDIDELFQRTLSEDYEDDAAWAAVHELRGIGTREVFDRASQWCQSCDPLKRSRGADILAQLGRTFERPVNNFVEDAYLVLTSLLASETVAQALASAIAALGHLGNPDAVPLIAHFYSHHDPDVRWDTAFALGKFPDHPLSVETLLKLMQDVDDDVRDWATFGLALGDSDSPEIREGFLRCIADSDEDVSEEALVGLAKRKDNRVVPKLLSELEQESIGPRIVEAATWMLDMDNQPEGWIGSDYVKALQQRFGL